MTGTTCPGCHRAMDATASLCVPCRGTLQIGLANVAAYHAELETVRSGLVRFGTGTSGARNRGEAKLGMDLRFSAAIDGEGKGTILDLATRDTLTRWATYVHNLKPSTAHPKPHPPAQCRYLIANADTLRTSPDGGTALTEVLSLERRLANLIDRPPDRWYAGKCGSTLPPHYAECDRELWAEDKATYVRCRDCGSTYDLADRRQALLTEAADYQATLGMIARIATTLSDLSLTREKVAAKLGTWAHRGRLTAHGTRVVDGQARPLYRIGDCLEMLDRHAAKPADKHAAC
jgi:hypothetical protein